MSRLTNRRAASGDRGAVLPIVALSLVTLMVMTAFSVDIGRQILRRREAQAVADVVALDMARMVDGRTRSQLESDPAWAATLQQGAARNNFPSSGLTAVLGHWDPYAQVFTASGPSDIPDAVQVLANDTVNFFFARVIGITSGNVNRSAVATQDVTPPPPPGGGGGCVDDCGDGTTTTTTGGGGGTTTTTTTPACLTVCVGTRAAGELGSVFAGFQYYNDPGMSAQYNLAAQLRAKVLNSELYTALGLSAGGSVAGPPVGLNLDALSYKGLANGFVDLGDLATTLGFGSVSDLLNATITVRDLITAEGTILRNSPYAADVTAGTIIGSFANSLTSTGRLELGDIITIAQGQGNRAATFRLNALDLITSSAEAINGKNFYSTTIATNIPGAPSVPIRVSIIEPPRRVWNSQGSGPCTAANYVRGAVLPPGCGPRTAQVRVAANIPTTLDLTPFGVPLVQATTVPVVFEAAAAQSYFTSINCAQPTNNSKTDFRVVTNGVSMTIGSVSDASLQSTNTMTVQGQALLHGSILLGFPPLSIDLDAMTAVNESKTFKNGAIYSGDMVTNAGVLGADETHRFTGNRQQNILPTSWRYAGGVGNTSISTTMFNNLGIANPLLNTALSSALKSSLANLDTLLMDPVLSSLGVTIAGADGAIRRVDCNVHLVK